MKSGTANLVEQTYWGAVTRKFWHDKIAMLAVFMLLSIISLSVGADWLATNWLGYRFDDVDLLSDNQPPTWANESWGQFKKFTRSCEKTGCEWSLWLDMTSSSLRGLKGCFQAKLGTCHWLGTDDNGRDVLTRVLYGGRISLRIGLYVAAISLSVGVLVGVISGYYAATIIDDIINAIIMTINSIPSLPLLIIISKVFELTPEALAFLLGILSWTGTARLIRGQIFSIRERDYVVASRAMGAPVWRIMLYHILPNISSIIIVSGIFEIAGAIIAEAGLSYLGVGIAEPLASWGNMMEGSLSNFADTPWMVFAPGIFIFTTTLSIFLIGDGLRDALDPWVKD